MTKISELKLFSTHPHPCSYIEEQQATTLFVDPAATIDKMIYSELADNGFRRSGEHLYRPYCEQCTACIAARVPVDTFKMKRRQRRIWKKNQDLNVEVVKDISADTYYQLYEKYISLRHKDGDMYPPDREQYLTFLINEWGLTDFYVFKDQQKIVAVAVTDIMQQGLSAIYTFYDPDYERRSLGVYAVLWQIEHTKALNLNYLYLGYWVKACKKMSYKTDYRPLQLLINNNWRTIT
jgi:arginine-tRNA-protein transferase